MLLRFLTSVPLEQGILNSEKLKNFGTQEINLVCFLFFNNIRKEFEFIFYIGRDEMKYLELQKRYLDKGLDDFCLISIEDFQTVFGIEVNSIKGFNELSENRKRTFEGFLINYLNRIGLNTKANFVPVSIHYVEEIWLSGKMQEEDEYYTEYSRQFYILHSDGSKEKMKRKGYTDKDVVYPFIKETKRYFLRFDFLETKSKIWLHVISPTEWY